MEYCVELWNPEYQGDKNKLELVQNKMSRLLRDSGVRSPEDRNNLLGITSHKTRRLRGDLINMFKYIEKDQLFTLCQNRRTRGNDKKLVRPNNYSTIKRHSFSYRSIDHWNNLPNDVVNSRTVNELKSNLDRYLSKM